MTCKLTDVFGATWPFNQGGPVRLHYINLGGPQFDFDDTGGVNQAGVTNSSIKYKPGSITAGVRVDGGTGGPDARALLATWRRGNGAGGARRPGGAPMRFTVLESGRFQEVRLAGFKNPPDFVKMHAVGRAYDEVEWRSDETWWRGEPLVFTFAAAQFATAKIHNDGDVDSWLHYKLEGPISSPTLGIGGEAIPLPTLTDGQWLDIETNPDYWAVWDQAGLDRSWIGERWHEKAPVDTPEIPVTITGTGATSATKLTVTVPRLYWSAL
ncbi:hypothetical protein [Williamsia sp.]|uniref:hypothetical protein n=1 Tax=Williamsia sp. TaxID=1872085 RepID=UPI002F921AA5